MDVFFCVNRVTLHFCVARSCKINDRGQALLKAHSLLWAHLPAGKYNAMNHYSPVPCSPVDIFRISLRFVISYSERCRNADRDNCCDWGIACALGDIKKNPMCSAYTHLQEEFHYAAKPGLVAGQTIYTFFVLFCHRKKPTASHNIKKC